MKKYKVGYTTGVFDLFHIGHLNILKHSKQMCEHLIVGVSTDELVENYKNKRTVIPFRERIEIVKSICYVDEVVPQTDINKLNAWPALKFNVLFVGSDWKGSDKWNSYEKEFAKIGVDIIYFPYTEGTSSTLLKEVLNGILER